MSIHAHLGVDLSDTGARAAAWRTHGSQGQRLFDAGRLEDLVAVAQRGALDFVVFDDDFALHPGGSTTRLDAALVAARLAPRTQGIGLVAAVGTTHTAPAHISTAIATIDQASAGRAGWQVGWSTRLDDVPTAGPASRRPRSRVRPTRRPRSAGCGTAQTTGPSHAHGSPRTTA